jgi:hypothetical protein
MACGPMAIVAAHAEAPTAKLSVTATAAAPSARAARDPSGFRIRAN